jgi:hypothetical protein
MNISWDDMMLAINEGLDGVEEETALKIYALMFGVTPVWNDDHETYVVPAAE